MHTHPLLMRSPFEADEGHLIGRDPMKITAAEYAEHLPDAQVGMKAIRAKCLECCNYKAREVRKCVCHSCPLWPLRLGRQPKGLRAARKEKE